MLRVVPLLVAAVVLGGVGRAADTGSAFVAVILAMVVACCTFVAGMAMMRR